jgi:predicted amidohydrolase
MKISVGFVQPKLKQGDKAFNLHHCLSLADALKHCNMIAFPELFDVGYSPSSRSEAINEALSDPHAAVGALKEFTSKNSNTVVAGVLELEGRRVYSSSVVISSGREVLEYRKRYLFGPETGVFDAGQAPPQVTVIDGVRLSTVVCLDLGKSPELGAMRGSLDLLVVPEAVNLSPGSYPYEPPAPGYALLLANYVGVHNSDGRYRRFSGHSAIVNRDGRSIHEAPAEREETYSTRIEV